MGANLTCKPCEFCGETMYWVGHRRMYCDDCQGHQAWRQMKWRYGIDLATYKRMLDEQGHVCAICGGEETRGHHLSVDHCHKTNKVRGLICNACNVGLSRFNDNPDTLRKAARYVELAA